ncbi:hypothetical protein O6B72_06440 [Campylobacter ureolyticus]|uniref:hypothetical protein n=1 Tax=Campylobacter ureolyticus TaxID=827 RepID=UPI0022B3D85D|nr:hypothetical protein [Campylobacter ureolyticus]MCZ6156447.1 hypothetical protein [Campylobacter ureolyticus]
MQEFDEFSDFIDYIKSMETIYRLNISDELLKRCQNLELEAKNIVFNHTFEYKDEFKIKFGNYIDDHIKFLLDWHNSISHDIIAMDDFFNSKKIYDDILPQMVENLIFKRNYFYLDESNVYNCGYFLGGQVLDSRNRRNINIDIENLVNLFCNKAANFFVYILNEGNNIFISNDKKEAQAYFLNLFESRFDDFMSLWSDTVDEYNEDYYNSIANPLVDNILILKNIMLELLSDVKNNTTFIEELYKAVDEAYKVQKDDIPSKMLLLKFISTSNKFLNDCEFDREKLKDIFKEFIKFLEDNFHGEKRDSKDFVNYNIFYKLQPLLEKEFKFYKK